MKVTKYKKMVFGTRLKGEKAITAVIWFLWIYLVAKMGYEVVMLPDGLSNLIDSILFYGTVLTCITAMITLWSFYSHKRGYKKKTADIEMTNEIAKLFRLDSELILQLQEANHLHVQFDEEDQMIFTPPVWPHSYPVYSHSRQTTQPFIPAAKRDFGASVINSPYHTKESIFLPNAKTPGN